MTTTAFFSGSFDPVTLGHLDLIERSAAFLDRLVIGVGVHDAKKPMFTAQDRIEMLTDVTEPIAARHDCTIDIVTFGQSRGRRGKIPRRNDDFARPA